MKEVRLHHDRFEDETVDIGAAYHPFQCTTLALDIRNLTEDSQNTTREFHVGIEQGLFGQVCIRAGYYRERFEKKNRLTFGFGLFNLDFFRFGTSKYYTPNMALNYSIMLEPGHNSVRWHFLSLHWGIGW